LIDFGAARQTLSEGGNKLPPTYTPGFASPEHHARRRDLGPWSDVYSVGATMYACLAAQPPLAANQRMEKDSLLPARRGWAGKYSAELLDTVDWCLRLDHMERPQSVFALQKALLGEKEPERRGEAPFFDQLKSLLGFGRPKRAVSAPVSQKGSDRELGKDKAQENDKEQEKAGT
jgi:hypothetical protein